MVREDAPCPCFNRFEPFLNNSVKTIGSPGGVVCVIIYAQALHFLHHLILSALGENHAPSSIVQICKENCRSWLVKVIGLFDAPTKQISQLLDSERFTPPTKARNDLCWSARDMEASIIETAAQLTSLISKAK